MSIVETIQDIKAKDIVRAEIRNRNNVVWMRDVHALCKEKFLVVIFPDAGGHCEIIRRSWMSGPSSCWYPPPGVLPKTALTWCQNDKTPVTSEKSAGRWKTYFVKLSPATKIHEDRAVVCDLWEDAVTARDAITAKTFDIEVTLTDMESDIDKPSTAGLPLQPRKRKSVSILRNFGVKSKALTKLDFSEYLRNISKQLQNETD